MRFIRRELSPANKKQYLLAVGKRDLELLLGMSITTYKNLPGLKDYQSDRHRINSAIKTLKEAIALADLDGDDGDVVPMAKRGAFQRENPKELDPMDKIVRLEVIDHGECIYCEGKGVIIRKDKALIDCQVCEGVGTKGRKVLMFDHRKKLESSIQDGGSTLKLFINDRPRAELGTKDCNTGVAIAEALKDLVPPKADTVYIKPWWWKDKLK